MRFIAVDERISSRIWDFTPNAAQALLLSAVHPWQVQDSPFSLFLPKILAASMTPPALPSSPLSKLRKLFHLFHLLKQPILASKIP